MKNVILILALSVLTGSVFYLLSCVEPSTPVTNVNDTTYVYTVDSALTAAVNVLQVDAAQSKTDLGALTAKYNALKTAMTANTQQLATLTQTVAELKAQSAAKPDTFYVEKFLGDGNLYFKNKELVYDTLHLVMGKAYNFVIYEDTAEMIINITMNKK